MRRSDWVTVIALCAFVIVWEAGVFWYLAPPAQAKGDQEGGGARGGNDPKDFRVGVFDPCRSCQTGNVQVVSPGFNTVSDPDKGGGGSGGDYSGGPNSPGSVGPGGTIGGGV